MNKEVLDIVRLIEKNPITRFNDTIYSTNFISKVKEKFTEYEQQLFLASFYCYLNYDSKKDFIIDFDDVWKWTGYSRKDPAKRVLEKYFTIDIDYKVEKAAPLLSGAAFEDEEKSINLGGAGLNKEKITLTVNTFKKFCLKSNTKKADEIHDYYIKLEDCLQESINEENNELRLQLQEKIETITNIENNHLEDIKIYRHNLLMNKFKNKKCIYISEIENEYIKIGSTGDIIERNNGLKKSYKINIFLDVFETDNFREIESYILKDKVIKMHLIEYIQTNDVKSQEVIMLDSFLNYVQLIKIVKKYIDSVKIFSPSELLEKQKLEFEEKKLQYNIINELVKRGDSIENIKEIFSSIFQEEKIQEITSLEEARKLNVKETQNPNYTMILDTSVLPRKPRGRKVQKIDSENLNVLLEVYESMIYALRAPENKGFTKTGVQYAIKNNTLYKGYRWDFVEKDKDQNVISITDTVKTNKPPIIDTIVKINSTQTKIVDTFYTKNDAAKNLNIGKVRMKKIIENNELHNEHYYVELTKCPQELIKNYDQSINKIIRNNSKQIQRIDTITGETIIFNSLNEINIKLGICSNTILNIIDNDKAYNGFKWKFLV